MKKDKNTKINVYRAAWLSCKGIEIDVVLENGQIQFVAPPTKETRTTLELWGLKPHGSLQLYANEIEKLTVKVRSLTEKNNDAGDQKQPPESRTTPAGTR